MNSLVQETNSDLNGINVGCPAYEQLSKFFFSPLAVPIRKPCPDTVEFYNLSWEGNPDRLRAIRDSNFVGASWRQVEIDWLTFEVVDFSGSNFTATTLKSVGLNQVKMRDISGAIHFDNATIRAVDLAGRNADVRISSSLVEHVDFSNALNGAFVEIIDSMLLDVDFTGVDLSRNQIQIVGKSNLFGDYQENFHWDGPNIFIDHPYPPLVNVSGAVFCSNTGGHDEPTCWEGLSQEFLNHAWFFEDNPPKGVEMMDQDLLFRLPCNRPQDSEIGVADIAIVVDPQTGHAQQRNNPGEFPECASSDYFASVADLLNSGIFASRDVGDSNQNTGSPTVDPQVGK